MNKFWRVTQEEAGRLGTFLQQKLPQLSAKRIKRLLDLYGCRVNGVAEHFASRSLRAGDTVSWEIVEVAHENKSHCIWEDEDLLVIDKAAGLRSEIDAIKSAYGYSQELHLVHRLDAPTSGVMILAKNGPARKQLERQFAERSVQKTYLAVIEGLPKLSCGTVDKPLRHAMQQGGKTIWRVARDGEGLMAQTAYTCLAYGAHHTLVECRPVTGRTHQIRVHLHHLGHPIVGDGVYHVGNKKRSQGRLLLHARSIALQHPRSGDPLFFESEVPADMQAQIDQLIEP